MTLQVLPWWLSGKESTCQCRRCEFNPWVGKIPWRREMAPHSSSLAWEIPWTEEPGGLQSMGLQKSQKWLRLRFWNKSPPSVASCSVTSLPCSPSFQIVKRQFLLWLPWFCHGAPSLLIYPPANLPLTSSILHLARHQDRLYFLSKYIWPLFPQPPP